MSDTEGGLDFNDLMQQAQAMQEHLMSAQAAVAEQEVEGVAGGGAVRIVATGGMEFRNVTIDPGAVDPDDVAMLEDLVLAALNDTVAKANDVERRGHGWPRRPGRPARRRLAAWRSTPGRYRR